jgi:DNA-binding cell septation regulator SpoVG
MMSGPRISKAPVATAARVAGHPPPRQAKMPRFRPFRDPAGAMWSSFSAELPSGQVIHYLKLMRGQRGALSIAMPHLMRRDQDHHRTVLDDRGKPIWDPVIEFRGRDARDRFSALILAAFGRAHRELFAEAPK